MALDLLILPGLISAAPAFQTFLKLFLSFSGAPGLCILRCAVCVDFVLRVIFFFFFCILFSSALGETREKRRGGGSDTAG